MMQLTVRGFDKALERELHRLAEEKGISLNKAALELMRRGAGLERNAEAGVSRWIGRYAGTWTPEEADAFDEAVTVFDAIDEEMWR